MFFSYPERHQNKLQCVPVLFHINQGAALCVPAWSSSNAVELLFVLPVCLLLHTGVLYVRSSSVLYIHIKFSTSRRSHTANAQDCCPVCAVFRRVRQWPS